MGGASDAARGLLEAQTHEAEADAAKTGHEATTVLVQRYFGAQAAEARRRAARGGAGHHRAARRRRAEDAGCRRDRPRGTPAGPSPSKKPAATPARRDDAELVATALTRTLQASDRVTPTSPLFVLAEPLPPCPNSSTPR